MQKQSIFKIRGMQRDLSVSTFNSNYAYENKNIRITSNDDNTTLSLVNEKGNKKLLINNTDNYIKGTPIGQAVINEEIVLFTCGDKINTQDSIYKLWFENDQLKGEQLFYGDLNFNVEYPIETLISYENESIKKVYWVDGINQPRFINIASSEDVKIHWTSDSFNFVSKLKLEEKVIIEKELISNGFFDSGTIQYAFTYFNKYGQESNIFYTSPLYYVSFNDRGGSPEEKISNSFKITIDNLDKSFDFVRIYSIQRTSVNATPIVKLVNDYYLQKDKYYKYNTAEYIRNISIDDVSIQKRGTSERVKLKTLSPNIPNLWIIDASLYDCIYFDDLPNVLDTYISILPKHSVQAEIINNTIKFRADSDTFIVNDRTVGHLEYIDNGLYGENIDPTKLLYVGGEEVIFNTLNQKDNTLFFGDIKLKRQIINKEIKESFKQFNPEFVCNIDESNKTLQPNPQGYYPYTNQLNQNSHNIKTFKYLETYRLGIQLQHYTGKWSEPIWIKDVKNDKKIETTYTKQSYNILPVAKCIINNKDLLTQLVNAGYIKIRPVIVYPELSERECICQGILCPTVFNVEDRVSNTPFAQSSWFARANVPYDIYKTLNYNQTSTGEAIADWRDRESPYKSPSVNSRAGVIRSDDIKLKTSTGEQYMNIVNLGAMPHSAHYAQIGSNDSRSAEIQCITGVESCNPLLEYEIVYGKQKPLKTWIAENTERYYVDQSIVTLHSPDIEFDDSIKTLDMSHLKLRIVGIVPLTSFYGDIDIRTSTPPNTYHSNQLSGDIAPGFYKEDINVKHISRFGYKNIMSGVFWLDDLSEYKDNTFNNTKQFYGFVVYPWHRNGSLNNAQKSVDGYKSAKLEKKRLSNLKVSYNSFYFPTNKLWFAEDKKNANCTGISGVSLFDSNEVSLIKVPAPKNSNLQDISYYGNIDKVLTFPLLHKDKKKGYPIITAGTESEFTTNDYHALFRAKYQKLTNTNTETVTSTDPIRIKYKSTPHAVLALNYTNNKDIHILPTLSDSDGGKLGEAPTWGINSTINIPETKQYFWLNPDDYIPQIKQEVIDINLNEYNGSLDGTGPEYGWLWLGELYNDNVINKFGGTSEEAIENNLWLPCGESISIKNSLNNIKDSVEVKWLEGDTYYQRYDHIKTYPFTLEDQNQVTEVVSFMCETRVNLDGRYDRNRGQLTNFAITPANFNKLNDVYSQKDNYFNYRTLNTNKLNLNNFNNSITWSLTKTSGELIDSWTNINLASILELDGDKGPVRALKRFNNDLIAFQDKGISQILYNENMQIATTEGVPIEIANSGKVNGKRYIVNNIGCTNKWSICESSNGLYFIDDLNKDIYLFNGQLSNLSNTLGFHSWVNNAINNINIWNPKYFKGFVTYYDRKNKDILFINDKDCLAYSEKLGQFSSFYSYDKVPYIINIKDKCLSVSNKDTDLDYSIWLQNEGDYNIFYNKYQPFYTTIIANDDVYYDKIFNTVEFRSDSWNIDTLLPTTFDKLYVWNEYQKAETSLLNIRNKPSNLKQKFRIWRANIPRDSSNNRDRIRNPWAYIKLAMETENSNKTILHDVIVHYFI